VLDKLRVDVGHVNVDLALLVKELLHNGSNLVKKYGVQLGGHLFAHQFLYVLLDIKADFFIAADK